MNNELKQILWVESDDMVHRDFGKEAKEYGLELVPFVCWDDAATALKNNFDQWSAIILQPVSMVHPGSYFNAKQFLPQAFADISVICSMRSHVLPWYILTSEDKREFDEMVLESRKEWDGDWKKSYYNSDVPKERVALFRRIKEQTQQRELLQVRTGKFKVVYDALDYLEDHGMNVRMRNILEDMLVSLCFGTIAQVKIGNIREALEYVFKCLISNHLLPFIKNTSGNLSNGGCSSLLSGREARDNDETIFIPNSTIGSIMNKVMAENVYYILKISNSGQHSDENLSEYLRITKSNNMVYSCALLLCDIIIWLKPTIADAVASQEERGYIPQWWVKE